MSTSNLSSSSDANDIEPSTYLTGYDDFGYPIYSQLSAEQRAINSKRVFMEKASIGMDIFVGLCVVGCIILFIGLLAGFVPNNTTSVIFTILLGTTGVIYGIWLYIKRHRIDT